MTTKICLNPECGKEFSTNVFTPFQKYCGDKCAHKGKRLAKPDKYTLMAHDWEKNNKARAAATAKIWHQNNKEKNSDIRNKRRALKRGAVGNHYTRKQFRGLCNETGNVCLCCGEKKRLTADHIVPLSKGGSDSIDNIQPLCINCNDFKGTKTIDYNSRRSLVCA